MKLQIKQGYNMMNSQPIIKWLDVSGKEIISCPYRDSNPRLLGLYPRLYTD